MPKASEAGALKVGKDGATLKDVLGALLHLPAPKAKSSKRTTRKAKASKRASKAK